MKLSIITVNLNNKAGLEKTLRSLSAQTFGDFESIVIDGGSTDGSYELTEAYLRIIGYRISEKDSGIYNAMNKGIRAAKGEYLLFLNSGDYLTDDVLAKVFAEPFTVTVEVRCAHGAYYDVYGYARALRMCGCACKRKGKYY